MSKRIIIGGGGTGGHIFPAISIANTLRSRFPETEILFVGALNRIEMEKVPEAGYRIIGLPVAGFRRRLSFENISFFWKLIKSMRMSRRIIREFRPDVAIGVGGYASGPILKAAASAKIPLIIQEQNSYAGITNRILSKSADVICVAYEGMDRFFPFEKIILTGNPVRQDIVQLSATKEDARKFFGLDPGLKTILILGGSQGARTINLSLLKSLEKLPPNIQILWQCGKLYYHQMEQSLKTSGTQNIILKEFIREMDNAYASADIIISRAGAGTISELAVVGKPVILVPSPNVAEDHQTQNALSLVNKGAGILVKDQEAEDKLVDIAVELLQNEVEMQKLSENLGKLAIRDSSERIVTEIIRLAGL